MPDTAPTPPATTPLRDGAGSVIARLGEIEVTPADVRTPAGHFPLAGSRWEIGTEWVPEPRIPPWAVVLALLGFFVMGPFSLFFLRIRRARVRGVTTVTVTGGSYRYAARIPVADQAYARQLAHRVDYVRSLAGL
jgi:hypothetical protein